MSSDRYLAKITKTADRRTIMNYRMRGQTRKLSWTIINNLNKLKLNDS